MRLRVTLLGGLDARLPSGERLRLHLRKAQALLAYLALRPGVAHPRDKLAALLWADVPDERARHSLRQALVALRGAAPPGAPPVLIDDLNSVAANPNALEVDVVSFERSVAEATPGALERASALYRGDLLEGIAVEEPLFEEWLVSERARLRELAVEAMAKLLAHQVKSAPVETAIGTAVRLLALEPAEEAVHRTLMRLYLRQGRRSAALAQYQLCVAVLQRELGLEPEAATRGIYREALSSRPVSVAPDDALVASAEAPPTGDQPRGTPSTRAPGSPVPVHETPLFGREAELRGLTLALEDARQGRGGVTIVLGEAGIGKTRLVSQAAGAAAREGVFVLLGRAYESEQGFPFGPWVDALRSGGVIAELQRHADTGQPWRRELGRLFPELGVTEQVAALGGESMAKLFEAFAQVLTSLTLRQPLVLALEDLHWADETSLRLLASVGRRLAERRVLLVATAREEELGATPALRRALAELDREARLTRITLPPLSQSDTLALVRVLMGTSDEQLSEQVWRLSAGNPLAIVETVRAVQHPEPETTGPRRLSPRLSDAIAERLDRLGERAWQLLPVAAVIARPFEFELLCRVADLGAAETAEGAEELVGRGILHAVGELLEFTHERIREVAYTRLPPPAQRLWHQRVAESLEALTRERGEPLEPAALAHHFTQAGLVPQAVQYLTLASQRAIEQSAYGEAVAHARRALELMSTLPDPGARLADELQAQLRLGEALIATRGYAAPEVQAAFARAREVCVLLGQRAPLFPAVAGLFHYYLTRGDVATAATLASQLLGVAQEGSPEHGIIAHLAAGDAAFWGGELEVARQHLARTLELAQGGAGVQASFGGHDAVVVSDLYGAVTCWLVGLPDTALARIERAAGRARDLEHPHSETLATFFAAWVHRLRGELEQARERMDDLRALSARGGFSFWALVASIFMGYRIAERGDPVAGVVRMEEALVAYRAAGAELGLTYILTLLAEAQCWAGRRGDALHTVAQAIALARTNGERFYEAELLRLRGELLAASGGPRDGDPESCFRDALRIARAQGARALELRAATTLHLWLGHRGGHEEARTTVAELYRSFAEGLDTEDLARARRLLPSEALKSPFPEE